MAKLTGVTTVDMVGGEITKVEYGGAVYAKVAGQAQIGDIVRRVSGSEYTLKYGVFLTVEKIRGTTELDCEGDGFRFTEHFDLYRKASESPQVSAPFAEIITAKIEAVEGRITALEAEIAAEPLAVGDRVLISGKSIFGADKDGMVGKFVGIDEDGDYEVEFSGMEERFFRREQLTKIAGTDAPVTARLKVGDYVVSTSASKYNYTNTDMTLGEVVEAYDDGAVTVKITAHTKASRIGDKYGVDAEYFRKATNAEVAAATTPPKPKTGDIVVITANTNNSRNKVGDIGKVGTDEWGGISVEVAVPGNRSRGIYTRYNEMRFATPTEIVKYELAIAQAAKDTVFTKVGRKPNEYRKGDLGRITDTKGASGCHEGDIVEVDRDFNGTKVVDAVYLKSGYIVCIEIVCFAEDRVDAKEVA